MIWKLALIVYTIQAEARAQYTCPAPWVHHEESCYFLHDHDRYDWMESRGFCDIHNAHLVTIQDLSENIFIKGLIIQKLSKVPNAHVWLGATDDIVEGNFTWYDTQTALTFTDWQPGEPNSVPLHIVEDCLAYYSHYSWKWADLDCHSQQFFICEKSIESLTSVVG